MHAFISIASLKTNMYGEYNGGRIGIRMGRKRAKASSNRQPLPLRASFGFPTVLVIWARVKTFYCSARSLSLQLT